MGCSLQIEISTDGDVSFGLSRDDGDASCGISKEDGDVSCDLSKRPDLSSEGSSAIAISNSGIKYVRYQQSRLLGCLARYFIVRVCQGSLITTTAHLSGYPE